MHESPLWTGHGRRDGRTRREWERSETLTWPARRQAKPVTAGTHPAVRLFGLWTPDAKPVTHRVDEMGEIELPVVRERDRDGRS
jgi:hypothetical protein